MTAVKAYWWKGKPNWGDSLTPLLLHRFAHVNAVWVPASEAKVVCVGSILGNLIGPGYYGTILGSGKLFESGTVPPHARVLALRGPLTAKGVPGEYVLGDPGLLAGELVQIETKLYDLCIIPHWSDKTLGVDPRFTKYPHVVIDPSADPLMIIRTIAQSAKVVSSSLHGLILADSLGMPRHFEATAHWDKEGGFFKVRDHDAAVGLPFLIGEHQEADENRVADLKTGLKDAFRAYGDSIRAAA